MSATPPSRAKELFEANLGLIQDLLRSVAGRQRLRPDESQDFSSYALLRMIENDYGTFRSFQGKCSLRTYLVTVVHRLFLDYRTHQWGKWRSCAQARRLGEVAIQLDRLIHRDGQPLDQAVSILLDRARGETTREELLEIASRLPQRFRPRFEPEERLGEVPAEGDVEELIQDRERAATARRVRTILAEALEGLSAEDRLLLKMRYESGFTVRQIAAALHLEDRPLYRRFEQCLKQLRARVERAGLTLADIEVIIGWRGLDLEVNFCEEEASAGSPSNPGNETRTRRSNRLARLSGS